MPIAWREDLKRRWPILVYGDPFTYAEWQRTMLEIFALWPTTKPVRLLVDRRYSAVPSTLFVRDIVTFLHQQPRRPAGGRVAVVAAGDVGFGMARMTELRAETKDLPCSIKAFRDWNEAEQWLDNSR